METSVADPPRYNEAYTKAAYPMRHWPTQPPPRFRRLYGVYCFVPGGDSGYVLRWAQCFSRRRRISSNGTVLPLRRSSIIFQKAALVS